MSYLCDSWMWLNFGLGVFVLAAFLSLIWAIRVTDVALFRKRIPPNAYAALALTAGGSVIVFGVWYDGYLVEHFHNVMPYGWAFLSGEVLGLALGFPLSKLGPR